MKLRLWICLLFSCFLLQLNAATINVPADHATIQLAVNASTPGDEIVVANGTYTESVNLDLMNGGTPGNIIIRAANALGATVDGALGPAFYATSIFVGDITLQDFNLDRNTAVGATVGVIDLLDVTGDISIIGNDFDTDFGGSAIYLDYTLVRTASIRILDNTTSTTIAGDNGDFLFVQTTAATVLDIVMDGNTVSGLEDHFCEFDLEGDNSVTRIRATDNTYSAPTATSSFVNAIVGAGSTNAQADISISGNMVTNPDGDAIFIETSGTSATLGVLIASNTFSGTLGAGDHAIQLGAQSATSGAVVRAIVENNTITNPAANGIYVNPETDPGNAMSVWDVVVSGNNISGTVGGDAGIYFDLTDPRSNYIINIDMTGNTSVAGITNAHRIDCGAATPTVNFEGTAADCATQISNTNTGTTVFCSCGTIAANAVLDNNIPADVGNFIWEDVNTDGDQDGGEPGIPGVAVNITGTQAVGGAVNRTTVTDSDGNYSFGAILPGTYTITVTLPP
ncbi:hypothetical protein N9933_03645, partial [bacterium]|nr:hypothetical protein [bacterium]